MAGQEWKNESSPGGCGSSGGRWPRVDSVGMPGRSCRIGCEQPTSRNSLFFDHAEGKARVGNTGIASSFVSLARQDDRGSHAGSQRCIFVSWLINAVHALPAIPFPPVSPYPEDLDT